MNPIKSVLMSKGFWMSVLTTIVVIEFYPRLKSKVMSLFGK